MRIVWTKPALIDRSAIYDHIEADNPKAAAELDETFMRAAEPLALHPEMGRVGRVAGTREWVAHPHYVLIYEIVAGAVTILALVHTSRQWPPLG